MRTQTFNPAQDEFSTWLKQLNPGQTKKISAQAHPFLIAYLLHHTENTGPHILISSQKKLLLKIQSALLLFEPEQQGLFFEQNLYSLQENLNSFDQKEFLRIKSLVQAQIASKADVLFINPKTLFQRVISPTLLKKNLLRLKKGGLLPEFFSHSLKNLGYQSRDRVEQPGEFSRRGFVLDIFCPLSGPLRIELMGDEIIQIKKFSAQTQLSFQEINSVLISPAKEWSLYDKKDSYQKIQQKLSKHSKGKYKISFSEWEHFLRNGLSALYTKELFPSKTPDFFSKNSEEIYSFLTIWKAAFIHKSPFNILDHFSLSPLVWNLDEWELLPKNLEEQNDQNLNPIGFEEEDIHLSSWKKENLRELVFAPPLDSSFLNPLSLTNSFSLKKLFKTADWPAKIKNLREKGMLVFLTTDKEQNKPFLKQALSDFEMNIKPEASWLQMKEEQEKNVLNLHFLQSFTCENLIWFAENTIILKVNSLVPPLKLDEGKPRLSNDFPLHKKSPSLKNKTPRPFKALKNFSETLHVKSFHFAELKPGDLVIHKQHGIGLFKTLEILNFGTGKNEFLVLEYKDGDLLYVPVYALHQVQKRSTPSSPLNPCLLDKLGSTRWLNTKKKAKEHIKNITQDLINLYSLRASIKRKKFPPISKNFEKFEDEFPFPETPDQQKAIDDILQDLIEKDRPADRLICGDTGFGKTEVAMRASFKVIEDGYQVCLIAPTTLLSFQHFERFKERFSNWPIALHLLNRFTPAKKQKQILKEIKEGNTDIVIGTHRLLSRDIYFKNLGLLIIDEEHLFGVKNKEKIKNWYSHVDTINLSATPIPRSFSMSLGGLRDMSLILTPPQNRKPVETSISLFKENLIKEAILKELNRKGQIIFIHNRIADIYNMERKLKSILPTLRLRTAHGKMDKIQEKTALDFFQQKFDLLLCTTIVESGMDFPKANTLFIHHAEHFGLSELHQLRGRVGRSERTAYCYLLIPPEEKVSQSAMERLKIIQENNQPGSGITIARYDLEMRGAGELMGREQSGFFKDIGYEMYFELLKENISLSKNEKYIPAPEPDFKFNESAYIPETYIPHKKTRILFYKKLSLARSEKEINILQEELKDFAGPLPGETENLILLSHLRLIAKAGHIREISHRHPFLYISLAESTALPTSKILKWIEENVCQWQNKETLKFFMEEESLSAVLELLKKLFLELLEKQD